MLNEEELKKNQEQHQQELKLKMQRIFGVIGFLFGIFFLVGGLVSYLHPDRGINDIKLYTFYGTISRVPEQHSPGRGEYISFEMINFPSAEFRLSGFALKALLKPILGAVNIGDSVLIQLDDYNYEKLNQKKPHSMIGVCTFRTKEQIFVTWSGYRNASISDNRLGIYIAISGIALCIYYSRQLYLGFRTTRQASIGS